MHCNEHLKHLNVSSVTVPDLALGYFPFPHIKHLRKLLFTNMVKNKIHDMQRVATTYKVHPSSS